MTREAEPHVEAASVLSFGSVEEFLEELALRPPDLGIVRVYPRVRRSLGKDGLGLTTASVTLGARRGNETLLAEYVVGHLTTVNHHALAGPEEEDRLAANCGKALAILEEEVRLAGFVLAKGAYALPEGLTLYRASCQRIGMSDGRIVDLKEQSARKEVREDVGQGDRTPGEPREPRSVPRDGQGDL